MSAAVERRFEGKSCALTLRRAAPGVAVVTFVGHDVGEFGDAPRKELERALAEAPGTLVFIDAREAQGASIEVSGEWAAWLKANRGRIGKVHMLTGSSLIRLSADFVRRYSALEDLMQVHADPALFDAALAQAVADAR